MPALPAATVVLRALAQDELRMLADAEVPAALRGHTEDGALPPAFVAARSLRQLAAGEPAFWCSTFLICRSALERDSGRVVGACGFKHALREGRVEIGYGVAPACQGAGAATQAVAQLLALAFGAGAREVLAEVSPLNPASTRVVQKLGFQPQGQRVDEDGETVVQWLATSGAPPRQRQPANPLPQVC